MSEIEPISDDRRAGLMKGNAHFRSDIYAYEVALTRALEENGRLREALEPFAKEAAEWDESVDDDHRPRQTEPGCKRTYDGSEAEFTVGDLRRAREAYEEGK
ncbi:MAG: hypothetical protein KAH44_11285 [Oricola sp.]|jgi:hypothetical protein|nr:hypothetical protein [Oricola sp.]